MEENCIFTTNELVEKMKNLNSNAPQKDEEQMHHRQA